MNFEHTETLPKFLSSLSHLALDHSRGTGSPVHFDFTTGKGQAQNLTFFSTSGNPKNPSPALASDLTQVLTQAQADNQLTQEGSYSIISTGDTVTVSFTPAPGTTVAAPQADPGNLSGVPTATNDGLTIISSLKKYGNSGGYTPVEIDQAAKFQRVDFSPELRLYRANVKEGGKVAEGPHGDVHASPLRSDFGASKDGAPLPVAQPTDRVQPLRQHTLWIEIAQDSATRYAADLAPGAAGTIGQIIGRAKSSDQPPLLVAHSLTDFITGQWVGPEEASTSWTPHTPLLAQPHSWELTPADFTTLETEETTEAELKETSPLEATTTAETSIRFKGSHLALEENSTEETSHQAAPQPEPPAPTRSPRHFKEPEPITSSTKSVAGDPRFEKASRNFASLTQQTPSVGDAPHPPSEALKKITHNRNSERARSIQEERFSMEVTRGGASSEPNNLLEAVASTPILDSSQIADLNQQESTQNSSPLPRSEAADRPGALTLPDGIFAVKKAKKDAEDRSRKGIETDSFIEAAFGGFATPDEDDEEDLTPQKNKPTLRKALKRFFS